MKKKRGIKMNARRVQESDQAIGERILARRNQIEMSQEDLGSALGVSFQQIQKYEKGVNRLSSGRLIQLAHALQCSVTDLIGGEGNTPIVSTPFSRYAASKEGVAIINAMAKISSPAKLRDDQRRCGADVALIISQALPKHIEQFDLLDGVWVAHPRCALPVAVALRQTLIDVNSSRLVQQGQQTKMEQVYQYLTRTKFRQRVEAVVEKFNDMRDHLDRERKFMARQWSKRETQIVSVIESTVGMVGDLQAIAGNAMPEIPSIDLPLIENMDTTQRKAS